MQLSDSASALPRLGWDDEWDAAFADHRASGLAPARVAIQHRGAFDLATADGELRASASPRLLREPAGLPAVGDWVGFDPESGLVEALLPRRTALSRKEAGHVTGEQVLAANVDVAFLLQGLPLDLNVRRLERYLAMAWESGAQPVVVLTKTDLVDDPAPFVAEADTATLGACPVQLLSARSGEGLEDVRAWFGRNRTGVVLGSSGVGKSTLVNALVGAEVLATREVRADDQRGRHTTTHRELVVLPDGGVVLDTPGIRELRLWDGDLERAFRDVEAIASTCRFSDCAHRTEPGCAVQAALLDGSLSAERWSSYLALERELRAMEVRRDHRLKQEQVREYKIRTRAQRARRR